MAISTDNLWKLQKCFVRDKTIIFISAVNYLIDAVVSHFKAFFTAFIFALDIEKRAPPIFKF